ncbi:MAG: FxsA family protein [bacterium]
MLLRLFALFVIVPLVELTLILVVGKYFGVMFTIALVILTAMIGATMARYEGLKVLERVWNSLKLGRIPGDALLEGLLILAGGVTFLTPGFITDTIGILCVIPYTRQWFSQLLKKWIKHKLQSGETEWIERWE